MFTTILLLGTNLGDRKNNLKLAKTLINKEIGEIKKESKIVETSAVEYESNNLFLNQAMEVHTILSPIQLLYTLKKIEKKLGRKNDSTLLNTYTDRVIDLDIVTYDNIHYKCKELVIPHHRHLNEREFSKQLINNLF